MKIKVIIANNPYFLNSASANRWLTLLEGLSQLGFEIEMLITDGYTGIKEFKKAGLKGCYKNIRYKYIVPIFNNNIWLRRVNTYILLPFLQPLIVSKTVQLAMKEKDVIIWPSCYLTGLVAVNKIKKKNPKARTFMELSEFLDIHRYNKGTAISKRKEDKVLVLFERKSFYQFDAVALMTKTLYRHYESFPKPGPKLLHLPMTVDLDRFGKEREPPVGFIKPYIAFVGSMNDIKEGISILIKAFNKVKDLNPKLKLYLVGPWHYDTPLHLRLIKELKLEDRIIWMGEYSRDEIPGILQNAELLVLPRPDSRQAQGGFPTKLGEYLATGVPVCATSIGEIPDYLKDNESVFFAEPGSVESFADSLKRALNNYDKAKLIGSNGYKIATISFNKDTICRSLYNFLEQIF